MEPLFRKPLGPSRLGSGTYGNEGVWGIPCGTGTTSAVTCELCGTNHPEIEDSDPSYSLFHFMGRQGVQQCCGAVLDEVFSIAARPFAVEYLNAAAGLPPNDPVFREFVTLIAEAAKKSSGNIAGLMRIMNLPA